MKLYRIHHVIGKDSLHRIRIESVANGQNVGNSGEGFNNKQEAIENAGRCLRAYLEILDLPDFLFLAMQNMLRVSLAVIPTIDERDFKLTMRGNPPDDTPVVADLLRAEGFTVAEGVPAVQRMIDGAANDETQPRCSGYGVFPDGGGKCPGCGDCLPSDPCEPQTKEP